MTNLGTLKELEYHLKIPAEFDHKVLDALHALGDFLFSKCSTKKAAKKDSDEDQELLSEQFRILSPILPPNTMDKLKNTLPSYAKRLFTELMETFGTPAIGKKIKKVLRREESHVSDDNQVWHRNQRRETHIKSVKELLDVITSETTFSQIINKCRTFEDLWMALPKSPEKCEGFEPDTLVTAVEELEKERPLLSKLSSTPKQDAAKEMDVAQLVTDLLERAPVLNKPVVERLAKKYDSQCDQVIKTSPLLKKDAPPANSEMLVLLAYTPQYDMRHFSTALNQRKRNAETERKFTAVCTLPCELESMKALRLRLLQCDQKLLRNEMDHRSLAICAHVQDKNLRAEQLKQLRFSLIPTVNFSSIAKPRVIF